MSVRFIMARQPFSTLVFCNVSGAFHHSMRTALSLTAICVAASNGIKLHNDCNHRGRCACSPSCWGHAFPFLSFLCPFFAFSPFSSRTRPTSHYIRFDVFVFISHSFAFFFLPLLFLPCSFTYQYDSLIFTRATLC